MDPIHFVDTTFRDGHLSLWASGMTTGMMLPVCERMDAAGFEAMEVISGSNFKKCVRELKEDPFDRISLLRQRITRTPLRAVAGRINTFGYDAPTMYRLYITLIAARGISQVRILDPWNEFSGWERKVNAARDEGVEPVLDLIYSVSPKHTDEYYAERTRRAATLPVFRLCLKDPGGLLTPERTRTLVPVVLANAGGVPVEFHTHCTTGLGPLCVLEAVKAGIRSVNTAMPPLANASSNPSLFNVAANLRALGYSPVIDDASLRPVSDHFTFIAQHEGLPIGAPVEYDYSQYLHQVPGGMISNLAHQLSLVGLADRLPEALEETARVRAEFGYPIMVTPLSQFVGSQAAINIVIGERYKQVTDQTINYALGRYGEEGAAGMDPEIKDMVLSSPRARELAGHDDIDFSLRDMRRKYGGAQVSDEDVLLRWLMSKEEVDAMRAAAPSGDYVTTGHPLVRLIRNLSTRTEGGQVQVEKPGFSLKLKKGGPRSPPPA